ncbi:hypothetical protein GTP07_09540 [Lactococcus lactis]|uniref:hypothetical protein n=1 Tax=Lactococcus lactis TaxID=1358 RepID=UPI0013CCBD8D|nr:hypothetical protein [Lactococcus lactis]NEX53252.1 hypothetical protein [Lactococcus lactis]
MSKDFEDFRRKLNDNPKIMEEIFEKRFKKKNIVDNVSAMPNVMFDMIEQYHIWLNESESND